MFERIFNSNDNIDLKKLWSTLTFIVVTIIKYIAQLSNRSKNTNNMNNAFSIYCVGMEISLAKEVDQLLSFWHNVYTDVMVSVVCTAKALVQPKPWYRVQTGPWYRQGLGTDRALVHPWPWYSQGIDTSKALVQTRLWYREVLSTAKALLQTGL